MVIIGRCKWNDKTRLPAKTFENQHRTSILGVGAILFKTNIDAERTPPNFSLVIKRPFRTLIDFFFILVPTIKIFTHSRNCSTSPTTTYDLRPINWFFVVLRQILVRFAERLGTEEALGGGRGIPILHLLFMWITIQSPYKCLRARPARGKHREAVKVCI